MKMRNVKYLILFAILGSASDRSLQVMQAPLRHARGAHLTLPCLIHDRSIPA